MASKTMDGLTLSDYQMKLLENSFKTVSRHPDGTTLMLIAAECGLTEEETQKWFKRRNAEWRQAEGLPAEHRSVLD
ncbi:homeodomain-only protein [Pempheris klunzingeri]|uniref:homeodomain-only protein n=1 Tax=Pempheris klunzingeri TaxID=3127111 RepID=UPI00397EF1AC